MRLEKTVRERDFELTEEQILALERFDPEYRERHIEVKKAGELVAVDIFFAGTLKGVGKVYIQMVLDCFSRYVWGRLYTSKMPVTAVQILNNHVLPLFEEHGVKVETVLSDNSREFCCREDQHPYELILQLEEIKHRKTKVSRPQSNSFIERLHRTLLDGHLTATGRTTWHGPLRRCRPIWTPISRPTTATAGTAAAAWTGRPRTRSSRRGSGKLKSPTKSTRKEVKTAARSADFGEAGCQVKYRTCTSIL